MDLVDALQFLAPRRNGVLATQRRDGRPQLSNITYHLGGDGLVRISITATRAKYHNLVRDPRASLHVAADDFWSYVVVDGDVELAPVAADPNDATVDELVAYYRELAGEHPNWDEYRLAMVNDRRTMVRLTPTHVYGMLPQPS
jgi:PPOX class probable F420-dependent enzyme